MNYATKKKYQFSKWSRYNNTAWGAAQREGLGLFGYLKLNITIMAKVLLFVYVASKVGGMIGLEDAPLKNHPVLLLLYVAVIGYVFRGIVKGFEVSGTKRLEGNAK